jgi:hypothetical protein
VFASGYLLGGPPHGEFHGAKIQRFAGNRA